MAKVQRERCSVPQPDGAAVGGLRSGLVGGLLASVCCLPPALALVLGLAGSTFLSSLATHETEFRLAGLTLTLAAAAWTFWRRARVTGNYRSELPSLLVAVGTFVGASLTIAYVVTPFLYYLYGRT